MKSTWMLDTFLYRVGCWTTGKSIKWTWGSINLKLILQFCHENCCKQYLYQVVQLQRAHINSSQLCAILGAIAKYGAGKMKSLNISGTDVSKVMVMVMMRLELSLMMAMVRFFSQQWLSLRWIQSFLPGLLWNSERSPLPIPVLQCTYNYHHHNEHSSRTSNE